MPFLDKKARIMDVSLTARGRKLLAGNQLAIRYYAFSDELIDYSGSLSQSLATGAPLDEVIERNFVGIYASQMANSLGDGDLTSLLYTAPEQRSSLPIMVVASPDTVNLDRTFSDKDYYDFVREDLNSTDDKHFIVAADVDETKAENREEQYTIQQRIRLMDREEQASITVSKG